MLSVDHGVILAILLADILLLTELRLLLLLYQVAESTAAGRGDVSDAGTLKVVLAADVAALHGFWDPVKTEAHGREEEKALHCLLVTKQVE